MVDEYGPRMSDYPDATGKKCPKCGSHNVAKILYGYHAYSFDDPDFRKKFDNNEITLGGCCVSDGMPRWECNECNVNWGSLNTDKDDDDYDDDYDEDDDDYGYPRPQTIQIPPEYR